MTSPSADLSQSHSEPASAPFRISPSVYFHYAFAGRKVAAVSVICLVIISALIAVSVIYGDMRFLLISLMVIFIGVPVAMSFVWFSIALSPEAARSTLLHTVTLRNDGTLLVRWIPDEVADGDDGAETQFGTTRLPADVIIRPDQIVSRRISRSNLIYKLSSGGLVIVPLDMINLNRQEICQFEDFA